MRNPRPLPQENFKEPKKFFSEPRIRVDTVNPGALEGWVGCDLGNLGEGSRGHLLLSVEIFLDQTDKF